MFQNFPLRDFKTDKFQLDKSSEMQIYFLVNTTLG